MMNFQLSEEQQMLKNSVRSFVDKEIMPYIADWDRKESMIWLLIKSWQIWG